MTLCLLTFFSFRYVVAFLLVAMLAKAGWLLTEARPGTENSLRQIALALFALTFLGVLTQCVEGLHQERRAKGMGGMFQNPEVTAAANLHALGVPQGAPVAEIGDLAESYFPHAARLRVLARVDEDKKFWMLSSAEKHRVYNILAAAGMRDAIARAPVAKYLTPDWIPIGDSPYVLHPLSGTAP